MDIALVGYGRMGHEIEAIAIKRGHVIKLIVDEDNTNDLTETKLKGIDVAIEFSLPAAASNNIIKCLEEKIPVVSGTTGWLDDYNHVVEICKKNKVKCSICGQAPSVYPEVTKSLIEWGMTSISVNPDVIIKTRELVAKVEKKI